MSASLAVVAIASGSALVGAAIGQLTPLVQHVLARRQDQRTRLRDRYERMALLAARMPVYLAGKLSRISQQQPLEAEQETLAAATEMYMLALLYFPELRKAMRTLYEAVVTAGETLHSGKAAPALAASKEFAQAKSTANEQLQQFAPKYAWA